MALVATSGATLTYISMGSNIGDRAAALAGAVESMGAIGIRVLRQSSVYATEPVDAPPQDWFLNAVVEAETTLAPEQLLHGLLGIEYAFGRERIILRGPRTLDLDVLFHGSSVISTDELDVPHPQLAVRRFVLVPLAELVPNLLHPTLHKTIAELLADTPDRGQVQLWRPAT